jgi:hypothetical protein
VRSAFGRKAALPSSAPILNPLGSGEQGRAARSPLIFRCEASAPCAAEAIILSGQRASFAVFCEETFYFAINVLSLYSRLRCAVDLIFSNSRYFATVRLATVNPSSARRLDIFASLIGFNGLSSAMIAVILLRIARADTPSSLVFA